MFTALLLRRDTFRTSETESNTISLSLRDLNNARNIVNKRSPFCLSFDPVSIDGPHGLMNAHKTSKYHSKYHSQLLFSKKYNFNDIMIYLKA